MGEHRAGLATTSLIKLPPRPTTLIGRESELQELRGILLDESVRLLTITGAPGVGKTRLAVELAATLSQFPHGIVFVDLSPVSDPALVSLAVAQALGVEEPRAGESVRPIGDRLRDYLAERHLLLVLDNFEQVVDAAEDIAQILASCAHVKVLATSRSPLRLQWEHEFTLEPLALPPTDAPAADMQSSPAVRLFAQRAKAAVPAFRLTEKNARTVAEICARLDGLPLAIELAAPHVKMLSLSTLLEQLQHRLHLLTGGPRDFPPRHRTLRAAISSSYDLLSPQEQALFRRLTVFSGGFSMDGVEAIGGDDLGLDLLAALSSLGDHQMVTRRGEDDAEARYSMLESLREFGLEQLDAAGEVREIRRRHAKFFAQLADAAQAQLRGPQQRMWWLKLDEEQDNMWDAIRWAVAESEPEIAIRMAVVLGDSWYPHARLQEAALWTKRALALEHVEQKALRAQGLLILGQASLIAEELGQAKQYLEESAALFLEAEDPAGASEALGWLGMGVRNLGRDVERAETLERQAFSLAREGTDEARAAVALFQLGWTIVELGRYAEAKPWFEECLALARRIGDRLSLTSALLGMGAVAAYQGNLTEARSLSEERLSIIRGYGSHLGIATALFNLGLTILWQGDVTRAAVLIEESLPPYREYGERRRVARALQALGHVRELQGKWGEAAVAYQESLAIRSESPQRADLDYILLEGIGSLAAQVGHPDSGARLLGKAESVFEGRPRTHRHPPEQAAYEMLVQQLIGVLGKERLDEHRRAGRTLSDDQAIEEAHHVLAAVIKESAPGVKPRSTLLSRREEEVAGLVARGLSNRAIAQRLFISERTADTHVQHILNKLGFNSRAQIAAWAVQQGLGSLTSGQ